MHRTPHAKLKLCLFLAAKFFASLLGVRGTLLRNSTDQTWKTGWYDDQIHFWGLIDLSSTSYQLRLASLFSVSRYMSKKNKPHSTSSKRTWRRAVKVDKNLILIIDPAPWSLHPSSSSQPHQQRIKLQEQILTRKLCLKSTVSRTHPLHIKIARLMRTSGVLQLTYQPRLPSGSGLADKPFGVCHRRKHQRTGEMGNLRTRV